MSDRELRGLEVLQDLDRRRLTTAAAGQLLGLHRRQVFRLLKVYRIEGSDRPDLETSWSPWESWKTLLSVTAYHSFSGEVERRFDACRSSIKRSAGPVLGPCRIGQDHPIRFGRASALRPLALLSKRGKVRLQFLLNLFEAFRICSQSLKDLRDCGFKSIQILSYCVKRRG
jgi:hypothetical protein